MKSIQEVKIVNATFFRRRSQNEEKSWDSYYSNGIFRDKIRLYDANDDNIGTLIFIHEHKAHFGPEF